MRKVVKTSWKSLEPNAMIANHLVDLSRIEEEILEHKRKIEKKEKIKNSIIKGIEGEVSFLKEADPLFFLIFNLFKGNSYHALQMIKTIYLSINHHRGELILVYFRKECANSTSRPLCFQVSKITNNSEFVVLGEDKEGAMGISVSSDFNFYYELGDVSESDKNVIDLSPVITLFVFGEMMENNHYLYNDVGIVVGDKAVHDWLSANHVKLDFT